MTQPSETNPAVNPNVFPEVTVWYSDDPIPVTPAEQTILAESAGRYDEFASAVEAVRPAAQRYLEMSPGQWRTDLAKTGEDPYPLGAGLESVAYSIRLEDEGQEYVVRFPKSPDPEDAVDSLKLRLRNLARARAYEIPHTEMLVTHSIPEVIAVTEWAKGMPVNELSPDAIQGIGEPVLEGLQETATKLQAAGLALDVKRGAEGIGTEEPLDKAIAHYDENSGPTYFDLIDTNEGDNVINEAGQHFAELVTAMVATDRPLEVGATRFHPLTLREVTSRLALFDRAYQILQQRWPESTGLGWLERTAGRMIQTLDPRQQGLVMGRGARMALPLDFRQDYGN